jgi:hypothetical protein
MNKEIPCIDCLCIPACKNKTLLKLINECNLTYSFVMKNTNHNFLTTAQSRYKNIRLYLNTGIVRDET